MAEDEKTVAPSTWISPWSGESIPEMRQSSQRCLAASGRTEDGGDSALELSGAVEGESIVAFSPR